MRIILIGYMGCGKTTVGKKLANRLKLDFIDMDLYIEKTENKTISDIFKDKGEVFFREKEHKYLKEILLKDNVVLSTGGGTPCYNDNIDFMNDVGITIYLQMDATSLYNRLLDAKDERPLIKGKTNEELKEYINESLKQREPYYLKAKHTIRALDLKVDDILEIIE